MRVTNACALRLLTYRRHTRGRDRLTLYSRRAVTPEGVIDLRGTYVLTSRRHIRGRDRLTRHVCFSAGYPCRLGTENFRESPVVIPVYSSREAGPWGRPRDQEVFEVGQSPAQTR